MSKLERVAIPVITCIVVVAYGISRTVSNEAFSAHWISKEDGLLEWLTALSLLSGAVLCWQRCWSLRPSRSSAFLGCTAIYGAVLFFGMGEEVSWGQRVFGFETPESLAVMNSQQETNIHNLIIGGTNINRLIFGKMLAVGLACYLILVPLLYRRSPAIANLLNQLGIPVARMQHVLPILFLVLLIETSPALRRGEITEFATTSMTLLLLLNPYNISTFRICAKKAEAPQISLRRAA